jgi:yersiniabactin nonribosomal peptide synthetase
MTRQHEDQLLRLDLAAIQAEWRAVLERDIGPDDDFFAVGGDSLRAIEVAERIRRQLEVPVEYIDVFDYPTPSMLAGHVARLRECGGDGP